MAPTAVRKVVAHVVSVMARQVGMDEEEAVHLVVPATVADVIMKASTEGHEGVAAPHAVRPTRNDDRVVNSSVESLGHLVMATAQAGKYASFNGDTSDAAHLLDLATEIGAALIEHRPGGQVEIPVGAMDEAAQLVEAVAVRLQANDWTVCACGEQHEQEETNLDVVRLMRLGAARALDARRPAARQPSDKGPTRNS
ncbi:hypothetical protein OK074_5159 [Actinobacteria bacterium OK074]|nr:hypothetical protein OK074_5159 [Actinobacteria bacterium OK074]